MEHSLIQQHYDLGGRPTLDVWLRFAPPIQARYDQEEGAQRIVDLQFAIFVGLAFYNVYNITNYILIGDTFWTSVLLRVGFITPTSLALIWLIGRTPLVWTERLITVGMLNAHLLPVFLFWETRSALGVFTFGELSLTIIFGNMMLALRFPHAVLFTSLALASTLLAIVTKNNLETPVGIAFVIQIATASAFGLYANYLLERRRCGDYLTALEATLLAESADAARKQYEDLSRTDALTRLPNRRHLSEQVETWLSDSRSIGLMMIDVDHFKFYNDSLGHPAGDACLQEVSAALANATDGLDDAFCARFGGEEFSFVLRNASEMSAAGAAEAILQAVADLQIPHPSRPDRLGVVTVSIGIVVNCSDDPDVSFDHLIEFADRALYVAKRHGRNTFSMDSASGEAMRFCV